jgi:hypothetical protein
MSLSPWNPESGVASASQESVGVAKHDKWRDHHSKSQKEIDNSRSSTVQPEPAIITEYGRRTDASCP